MSGTYETTTADAIERSLQSPNVCDSNGEHANVVDVLDSLAHAASKIARAITPGDAVAGHDETGGTVESLTEAVMGVTAGLCKIANAIDGLAEAVRQHGE